MYIIIREEILKRTDLSGEEKILLAYIDLLKKHDKYFFGSEAWCLKNLGFADLESKKRKLIERGFCEETPSGQLVFAGLPEMTGKSVQPSIKARTQKRLERIIADLKCKGWLVIGESEEILEMTKDGDVMHIPKQDAVDP